MPISNPAERNAAQPEITGWRIRVYYISRNPHVLFWTAIFIVMLGIFIGRQLEPAKDMSDFDDETTTARTHHTEDTDSEFINLDTELKKPKPELERVVEALRWQGVDDEKRSSATLTKLRNSQLAPHEIQIAAAYLQSVASPLNEPGADLLVLAYQPLPLPLTNELVADLYAESGREDLALEHYQKELSFRPNAESTVKKLVSFYWDSENFPKLTELQADPANAHFFNPEQTLEISIKAHNWKATLRPLWDTQVKAFENKVPIILTAIAGLLWLILAWQMVQTPGLFHFRTWGPLVAIALGAASTYPVLFLDIYQSEMWGLKHTGFFLNDCTFFIAGVGVREELCKWIAFLPLLVVLLIRGSRLETIIVAGCVGLGFAVEENVSYFSRSDNPATAFGRFLTANFFHFAATGLIGVASYDSLKSPKKWWKFPATFVVVSLAHGFYDAFISIPSRIFLAIGLSCFILLSLAFFREVSRERGPATDQLFPGATLIIGLSILVATVIVCAARQSGVDFALGAIAASAIFLSLFIYMFYILFRDGLEEEPEMVAPKYDNF